MSSFGKNEISWSPRYKGFIAQSLYLTMRDGVKLAVDLLLPKGLPSDAKVPTVVFQTRYWRANNIRPPFKWFERPGTPTREAIEVFAGAGYAMVFVDVRGTGASSGVWPWPWAREEVMDGKEVVDWICSQPWSNGKVGAMGTSYVGTTAELLSANNHPAVKAVIPRFGMLDAYADFAPGGIRADWFLKGWAFMNAVLDRNKSKGRAEFFTKLMKEDDAILEKVDHPRGFHTFNDPSSLRVGRLALDGVKPVDSDRDRRLLRLSVEEHRSNGDVYEMSKPVTYSDDRMAVGEREVNVDGIGPRAFKEDIERSGVAIYAWSGWFDASNAQNVIARFLTLKNPLQAVIGPWGHGALFHASPYKPIGTPVDPSVKAQFIECFQFLDSYLRDSGNGNPERKLVYYTMGEEKWKSTTAWPPANVVPERWFLSADHKLSKDRPSEEDAADAYTIDFEATTGPTNRWHTLLGGFAVIYPDRSKEDARLLTYTSAPLAEDCEITGHPIVTLYITSNATDGAFYAYLEGVEKTGKVTYITEGQLRAIHRRVSTETPPFRLPVPYHTFKRKDGMPLVPGEVAELTFGMHPTSILIKKGHSIRLAIAGHDKDTFARIPPDAAPKITVSRSHLFASSVDLPVVQH